MINLPIAELATQENATATAVTQQPEPDTTDSVEFQAVFEDTTELGAARPPQTNTLDTVALEIRDLLPAQTGEWQAAPTGPASMLYEMIAAELPEGWDTPEQIPNNLFGGMQELFETIQGLSGQAPGKLPVQKEIDAGRIVDQPPEKLVETDSPDFSELSDIHQSKEHPVSPFNRDGLDKNRVLGVDGIIPDTSKVPLPQTAKNISGQATAQSLNELPPQLKEQTGDVPLENADKSPKPSDLRQKPPGPEESYYVPRPRNEETPLLLQTRVMHSAGIDQGSNVRLFPASDAVSVLRPAPEPVNREQKTQTDPKLPGLASREAGPPQESPKAPPPTGIRDQVTPVRAQTAGSMEAQSDPVSATTAVLPQNAVKSQSVAAAGWTMAKAAMTPEIAPVAKSVESGRTGRILPENTQTPPANTPTVNQQVIQVTSVNTPVIVAETDKKGLFETGNPADAAGIATVSSHTAGPAPLQHNPHVTAPEIPRHIARQLADAARQMPDRPVELTLNPTELGRVRLTFTLTDSGINVAVLAERGETMDLMRRHIETLAQEFRDMGYADVGFQFSHNGQGDADQDNGNAQAGPSAMQAPLPEIEIPDPAKVSLEPSSGLDLRL